VETVGEPSPKFQLHAVRLPVDVSVNCTVKGACPLEGLAVKLAIGGGGGGGAVVTTIVSLLLLVALPESVTVSVTVKFPALVNVWVGFSVATVGEPSPKFQLHAVGLPVEVSVNCTVRDACPVVGSAVKLATSGGGGGGAVVTTIVSFVLLVALPAPVTVSVTMKFPAFVNV
jgi:hypothetical protein